MGEKKPNAWGLYDMHGNVKEWCQDWYGAYGAEAVTDPSGPATGNLRVGRGGDRISLAAGCRSANRLSFLPGLPTDYTGFRAALSRRLSGC